MKLKYNGNIIFESTNLEEIKNFQEKFIKEKTEESILFLEKLNYLNKIKRNISEREMIESTNEYEKRIIENYPEFVKDVESLGKKLFKDSFKDCYFFNIPLGLFGFELETKKVEVIEIGTILRESVPKKEDFEII